MSPKLRQLVKQKYDGKCAFCGCKLTSCHIWDIEPIKIFVNAEGELQRETPDIDNLMPACKSCEATRRKNGDKIDIEAFRQDIVQSFQFLRCGGMTATSYGKALRFDLIRETNNPVVFYFEKVTSIRIAK